jgi:hypothetical protein
MDWVSKRSACSLFQMFEKLRIDVENDVRVRQSLRPEQAQYKFSFAQEGDIFSVSRDANRHELLATVSFHLEENGIVARKRSGSTILTAKITLNNKGECRFKIGEEEYESWQLRRKALESIFFEGI